MTDDKEEQDNAPMTRRDFEDAIIQKAWQDPEYKKRLLASPKEVLQEEFRKIRPEVTFPENFQVHIHEETPTTIHITLPVNPADLGEFSDDEWLDNVAGGFIGIRAGFALIVAGVGAVNTVAGLNVHAAVNVNAALNVNVAGNVNIGTDLKKKKKK